MPSDKLSIRELVYLARLRQVRLPYTESGSEAFDGSAVECELSDCFPWVHTLNQCERMRARMRLDGQTQEETPVL